MLLSFWSWFLGMLVCVLILFGAMLLSMRSAWDREKSSPFECGFDPKSSARIPFSLRFFLLAVIFLVFDIEIVLLMPLPFISGLNMFYEMIFGVGLFLFILIGGLFHEWREGSLDWSE